MMTLSEIAQSVERAHVRIKEDILKTPLIKSYTLSELTGGDIFLKLENEQYTGSFKARGSLNKLKTITNKEQEVITASTGNHGLGFARAVDITGLSGTVFLPHHASQSKVKKIKRHPVKILYHGDDPLTTELYAQRYAQERDGVWVSPYNDYDIIAGQGTIAIELLDQIDHIDDILVTMGGGGLISGIGAYMKTHSPRTSIIGCEPHNSPEMTLSLQAGKIVNHPDAEPTLSDGSSGSIEPGAITFAICQKVVDRTTLVDESSIADGITMMLQEHNKVVEGAAAVTIAALQKEKHRYQGRAVVLVICGGNINLELIKSLL